jgi:hypothetical protein
MPATLGHTSNSTFLEKYGKWYDEVESKDSSQPSKKSSAILRLFFDSGTLDQILIMKAMMQKP